MPECSELAKAVYEAAVLFSRDQGISDIDALVKEFQKTAPNVTRGQVVNSIVEATTNAKQARKRVLSNLALLEKEAKKDSRLRATITEYKKHLERGTLPRAAERVSPDQPQAIQELEARRNDLRVALRSSDAAVSAKYDARIEQLTQRLQDNNFAAPLSLEDMPQSKALARKEFEIKQLQKKVDRRIRNSRPQTLAGKVVGAMTGLKSLLATLDESMVGIQGAMVGIAHPELLPAAVSRSAQAQLSGQRAFEIEQELLNRDLAPLAQRAGLFLSTDEGGRDDEIISHLVDRVPLVRGLARGYGTYLNSLRMDVFESMMNSLPSEPTLANAKVAAHAVNVFTLRGDIPGMQNAMHALNAAFWSPTKMAAEFQLLMLDPIWRGDKKGTLEARKSVAKLYARYGIGMASMMALAASVVGTDDEKDSAVILNPRSPHFLRIKLNGRLYNPVGGLATALRLSLKFATGVKESSSGELIHLRGEEQDFGKDLQQEASNYVRGRLAPAPAAAADILFGKDFRGKPTTPRGVAASLAIPYSPREISEAVQEEGVPFKALGITAAILGVGAFTPEDNNTLEDYIKATR